MSEQLKALKDIFPDYETDRAILEAKIKNVNLYKKTNELVLTLIAHDRLQLQQVLLIMKILMIVF